MRIIFFSTFIGLMLCACSNNEKTKETEKESPSTSPVITAKDSAGLKIAYYDIDTLQKNYLFLKNEYELISKKKNLFEKELLRKQSDFETFVKRNEERAQKGLLSQNQLAEAQNKAQKLCGCGGAHCQV